MDKIIYISLTFYLCTAQSSPDAQFQWHFNGAKLDKVGKELKLENIQQNQSGNYSCWAHNTVTLRYQSSEPSLINVIEKISGASISGLTAELIAGNSSLNLSCQASAGSISNRLWLKDGQSLSPSNRVTFTADNSSMNIKKVEKDDAGQYKCSLSNPISTATAERDAVVNYGPESVTVQGEKTVKMNTKVVLECSASSVPPAGFMWTFNETLTNVKTDTFIIEKANYNDSGDYTCVASNAVTGLKSTSVHTLVVKGDINQSNGGLSGGAIAAIVIVLLLVFAAVGAGIFIMKKKKTEMTGSPSGQGEWDCAVNYLELQYKNKDEYAVIQG
ncbi:carcinoembryonic antigen-related cell adhesion molecule 20-like [Scleropages formosus]|uniref:carcinoembryonic antigen-related cell adhesion molecule 20-like n=1 Tax=Scleropages formosus TaxID=113540 RepID=UPI0010FA922E|nr:carcinoembryonic antigen-related cell adhesion molecule 20-like [Scleropages formosus]